MNFDRDLAKVSGIAAVPTILDVVSKTTGMGFAAIARVTGDRWITCAIIDEVSKDAVDHPFFETPVLARP